MGIVYEIYADRGWIRVSSEEYELFQGRKRTRPAGIPAGFYEVERMLACYRGGRL